MQLFSYYRVDLVWPTFSWRVWLVLGEAAAALSGWAGKGWGLCRRSELKLTGTLAAGSSFNYSPTCFLGILHSSFSSSFICLGALVKCEMPQDEHHILFSLFVNWPKAKISHFLTRLQICDILLIIFILLSKKCTIFKAVKSVIMLIV